MNIEIITTSDGSHSLLNTELNETYHSHHGALQESVHVFIEQGLKYHAGRNSPESIAIFEVGFGTGLNALLTLQQQRELKIPVTYTSIEAFPVDESLWRQLNYAAALHLEKEFEQLHLAPWNKSVAIETGFTLHKLQNTLQNITLPQAVFDVVYFDAFAPNKQPDMWTLPILEKMSMIAKPGGVFVTYCAKGQLKRDLKTLGFLVETLPGPPGKKEMVRALKI